MAWIRAHVEPVGPVVTTQDRPWARVSRVPTDDGQVWFKACAPVQAFEPRLSARLSARWPDRVGQVIAHDESRGWLLLADAGRPVASLGNPPESWLTTLRGDRDTFALAMTVAAVAQALTRLRQRRAMPRESLTRFDEELAVVLRRALSRLG